MNARCVLKLIVTMSALNDALAGRWIIVEVVPDARVPAGDLVGAASTRHRLPPLTLHRAVPVRAASVQERPETNAARRRGEDP